LMMLLLLLVLALCLCSLHVLATLPQPNCRPFKVLYANGTDLCHRLYSNPVQAFRYVPAGDPEYNLSYTMWWFSEQNQNDAITALRSAAGLINWTQYSSGLDKCYLKSSSTYQKPIPSPNNSSMTECIPFRENACCYESTVRSDHALNVEYGNSYKWNRCGPISPQCERFFVQEDCMYECDPNIGLYRLYPPGSPNASGNEWIVANMPIKGDYCDMWYEACQDELFCGTGDFFSCAAEYAASTTQETNLSDGGIAGIIIGVIVLAAAIAFIGVLVYKERRGQPVFAAMDPLESKPFAPNQAATAARDQSLQEITTI